MYCAIIIRQGKRNVEMQKELLKLQLYPAKFFRASRQYIIGIDSIERIHFSYNYKLSIKLKNYPQVDIVVSKEKSAQLKEWIDK